MGSAKPSFTWPAAFFGRGAQLLSGEFERLRPWFVLAYCGTECDVVGIG